MVDGNVVGGLRQVKFGAARQAGIEAQQAELQNDLTLADNIRKLSGTDAALEFWKTTPSSQRLSLEKIRPLETDTETIQIKDADGNFAGLFRIDAQGQGTFTSREEAGIPAAAPKVKKPIALGAKQRLVTPTGEVLVEPAETEEKDLTKGTAFTNEKGERIVPFFREGKLVRQENLGKVGGKKEAAPLKPTGDALTFQIIHGRPPKDAAELRTFSGAIKPIKKVPGATRSDEARIRKEFTDLSKDFVKIRDAMGRVEASAVDPSAAGDLALIFNYMKILDPGSVVRESEFATAANAVGVPDRIRNIYNKVLSGERLAPNQRVDFVERARELFKSQQGFQRILATQFTKIAKLSGVDPNKVIVGFDVPISQAPLQEGGGERRRMKFDKEGKFKGE